MKPPNASNEVWHDNDLETVSASVTHSVANVLLGRDHKRHWGGLQRLIRWFCIL